MESELAACASSEATAPIREERLLLALVSVHGASAACAKHGDAATVAVLRDYYALMAEAAKSAGGRVVKVLGDGVLLAFRPERVGVALAALRSAQAAATRCWASLDGRCRAVVRAVTGPVVSIPLGPPGDERPDLYGHTLNRLFNASATEDFLVLPEREAPEL